MVGTYFAVSFGTLNNKEKIFMAFAWMPKATVQGIVWSLFLLLKVSDLIWPPAALGPVFLDNCIKYGKEEWKDMGGEILTLAVLSILITAPLGAICILALGPLLLDNTPPAAPAARSHETLHSHAPEICHEIWTDSLVKCRQRLPEREIKENRNNEILSWGSAYFHKTR